VKIGALIPVRLGSERLPGKAMLPIADRPVVAHLLDRVFASRYLSPERVVVCTTLDQSDDPLVDVVQAAGARVFRGSRDNILDRFAGAVEAFGFDAIVEADGDDPCVDPGYMDRCMEALLEDESLGMVTVQTHRAVSNAVSARLGVRHETPQALLIRDGRVVWSASHFRVTASAVDDAIRNQT
jgi:spore coat polysaccharide biosynthesis protein SpsF